MKFLLFAILLVLSAMAGTAESQCRVKRCETPTCQPIQCAHVQHYPVVCYLPSAMHCQPIRSVLAAQSPTSYWTSAAVSVCNAAGGQSTYTVVTATEGIACTQRPIVYGHDSAVILSGSIPANVSLASPASAPIVTNGYVPGTIVHSAPIPNQAAMLGNCNCGMVANVVASASQASPAQAGTAIPRGPFSLSGQVGADTGKVVPNQCELEFLNCCANGGRNCMNAYVACSEITGEPIRHNLCPQVAPTIDE